MVDVARAEGRPLNVPLVAPFTIASSRLESVGNVAVRVELRNGCVGWGEAPVLPSVTAENQPAALAGAAEACAALMGAQPAPLDQALEQIAGILPGHRFASVSQGDEFIELLSEFYYRSPSIDGNYRTFFSLSAPRKK